MSSDATDTTAAKLFYIYGRHRSERRFRPMDLSAGSRVVNLIFASRLTQEEVARFMDRDAPNNPEWTFEPRPIRFTQ